VLQHLLVRAEGCLELLEHLDLVGRTAEMARLFGIDFNAVLMRGSQVAASAAFETAPNSRLPSPAPPASHLSCVRCCRCLRCASLHHFVRDLTSDHWPLTTADYHWPPLVTTDHCYHAPQFRVEAVMIRVTKPLNYVMVSPSREQVAAQAAMECIPLVIGDGAVTRSQQPLTPSPPLQVMEPVSRFYTDPVLVLDFQSLYVGSGV
jgi:hypothetical protein